MTSSLTSYLLQHVIFKIQDRTDPFKVHSGAGLVGQNNFSAQEMLTG